MAFNHEDLSQNSIEDLRECKQALVTMLDSYGFTLYRGMVERALVAQLNRLLAPATTVDRVLAQQHDNGVYVGMTRVMQMLPGKIQELTDTIQAKLQEQEDGRPDSAGPDTNQP